MQHGGGSIEGLASEAPNGKIWRVARVEVITIAIVGRPVVELALDFVR